MVKNEIEELRKEIKKESNSTTLFLCLLAFFIFGVFIYHEIQISDLQNDIIIVGNKTLMLYEYLDEFEPECIEWENENMTLDIFQVHDIESEIDFPDGVHSIVHASNDYLRIFIFNTSVENWSGDDYVLFDERFDCKKYMLVKN